MPSLPQPDDLTSLILRTDFTDDRAWNELRQTVGTDGASYASDPSFADVTIQALIDTDTAADPDHQLTYVFLADALTMTDDEHPLLALDLFDEPGRTFRVAPRWFLDISANLGIGNLGFDEFADAADESGTYRGSGASQSD
ncbi:DUF6924 domain-containing protein [Cryptosporangium aurantiacum]|uniref:DUF6924 domain-containing protein n=1 Tax=Cryptosporangium aurantiacum TaxID=134849 RepID=UPI0011612B9C|nr:hypothetical protein [Cryptosporangium aurantiacum]